MALHLGVPAGNVGGVVLSRFVVTFDQQSQLLRLEAPERTLVFPRPRPRGATGPQDAGVAPAR